MRDPDPSSTAGLPSAAGCDAGVVFAVPIEADAFERLVTDRVEIRAATGRFHQGTVTGRRVAWCVAGVGADAAAAATRLLVDGHRPRLLISAGFAGGLDPALPRGSVVRPGASLTEMDRPPIPLAQIGIVAESRTAAVSIVTVSNVAATAAAKRLLATRFGAQLVDMETYAVASVARSAGIDCASVRVVSDDASQELPREVATLAAPQSSLRRLGAAVGAIGRRPRAAVDLWRLWEHAVVDGKTLAAALVELVKMLPIPSSPS
ncbi:MAG: hypothetical protein K8S94_05260 [Planctomycetia bacterium]|nr:hypothetical protein [Planctomycetia bacterium]